MDKFLLILAILPRIFELIIEIEKLFPNPGIGSAKLELVKNVLTEAYDGAREHWGTIEKAIGYCVAFCNSVGIFKKAA